MAGDTDRATRSEHSGEARQAPGAPLTLGGLVKQLAALASAFVLWLTFVGTRATHELEIGLAASLIAVGATVFVHRTHTRHIRLRPQDLAEAWRLPWYVLSGAVEITWTFLRDLLHLAPAQSLCRVTSFEQSSDDPVRVGRSVLATAYSSASPTSIVIGVDRGQGRLLFHELEPRPVSRMLQKLGAAPGFLGRPKS